MLNAIIVVDLPNSTTDQRVGFREALSEVGWIGHSIPFSYSKEFWRDEAECLSSEGGPDVGGEMVEEWFRDGLCHLAKDPAEVELLVQQQLERAAAEAGVFRWQALMFVSEGEEARVLSSP